jgi:hypothetical protein
MNIGSLFPPVNTTKLSQVKRSEVAVAGSEINKDASRTLMEQEKRKRRGQERRKQDSKPLLDSRSGRDRRYDEEKRSINLKV